MWATQCKGKMANAKLCYSKIYDDFKYSPDFYVNLQMIIEISSSKNKGQNSSVYLNDDFIRIIKGPV